MSLIIGGHLNKNNNFFETIKQVELLKTKTLQIFTGSPQRIFFPLQHIKANEIKGSLEDLEKTKEYIKKNKIKLFIHASYILNFCDVEKHKLYMKILLEELELAHKLGAVGCILHMGKRKPDQTLEEAKKHFVKSLQIVINKHKFNTKIILETAAGQGKEIGYTLSEFAEIYNSFTKKDKKKIGLCIDTCHVFVAGEPINTEIGITSYFERWDKLIGNKNITLFHLNDSKKKLGDRVDRHENINKGYLFTELKPLKYLQQFSKKYKIPLILETHDKTPYNKYADEIKLVTNL